MRRWFEFGATDPFTGKPDWAYSSNTTKRRGETESEKPPIFISMPHKATLFAVLQGTSLKGYDDFSLFVAEIRNGGSTASPAGDCTAEHVVNGANPFGWRVAALRTGGIWSMILGGFPQPGGGFTPPLFTFSLEPPDADGS
jgi:hypothetical protein